MKFLRRIADTHRLLIDSLFFRPSNGTVARVGSDAWKLTDYGYEYAGHLSLSTMSNEAKERLVSRMRCGDGIYVFAANAAHSAKMFARYKNAFALPLKKSKELLILSYLFSDVVIWQTLQNVRERAA